MRTIFSRLESPVSFFQHWVTHHCQLEQPAPLAPSEEPGQGGGASTTLTMERCNRCNHIFVEGTQRYKHHLHTCEQVKGKILFRCKRNLRVSNFLIYSFRMAIVDLTNVMQRINKKPQECSVSSKIKVC